MSVRDVANYNMFEHKIRSYDKVPPEKDCCDESAEFDFEVNLCEYV